MTEETNKSPVGSESAMRIIWESAELVCGEPYTADELSAKADPERYVWESEQGDWRERNGQTGFSEVHGT